MHCLVVLSVLAAVPPSTESFALVVTNNRSTNATRPTLHYADDDGVAYADLFAEQFGATHTLLLTQLDDETRALAPGYTGVPPPTLAEFDRAVNTLATAIEASRRQGHRVELFVVLAGHGDVENGQGYFELLDRHLTSRDVEAHLITKLTVDRLNLIVDSCNSYYLLNPRKPGGRRWAADALPTGDLSSRYPWVGTLVSTNAEAVSYEWSELQSGIFSYEVRSGLRGAADSDHDQVISYRELAAFIDRANATIVNEQYRPRVFFTEPKSEHGAALLAVNEHPPRSLEVFGAHARHFVVRTSNGVRVLDVHHEGGMRLALALPAGTTELELYERVSDGDRPRWVYRSVPAGFHGNVDELAVEQPPQAPRGEARVFEALFEQPFGPLAMQAWEQVPKPPLQPIYGVTKQDLDRLSQSLVLLASQEKGENAALASAGGSTLVSLAATHFIYAQESEPERIWRKLMSFDASSDASRAVALQVTERDFERVAQRSQSNRLVLTGLLTAIGGGALVGSILYASGSKADAATALSLVGGSALIAGAGVVGLTVWRSPSERAWASYRHMTESQVSLAVGPNSLLITASF